LKIENCKSKIAGRVQAIAHSLVGQFAIVILQFAIFSSLPGCIGPLDDEYYMRLHVPPERTRSIETLDIETFSRPQPPAAEAPASLDLAIEQARADALAHNLDLQVALLDPTIAAQSISEQEARFEALLFGDVTYAKTDRPVLIETITTVPPPPGSPPGTPPQIIRRSGVVGISNESITAEPGVALPLTTGGTLSASLPLRQSELDDFFEAGPQFSISQPLLRNAGPKAATYAIRVARYDAQITDARTKLQVMSVLADIDRAYWQLYAARRALEVRQQEYELAQRQLERARRLVEIGQAAEIEVVRAESGAAERLEGIIIAENELRLQQRQLKRVLNRPDLPIDSPTAILPVTPPDPVRYQLDASRLAEMAMDHRMELLEQEIELAKSASEIEFQRNQVLPLLNLDYIYSINGVGRSYGQAFDAVGSADFQDHIVRIRGEVPLGNEAARSALRRAIYRRLQRVHTRASRELTIRQEVLDAMDTIETSWQRIVAAQRRTILAARTVEGEQRQFDQGLRTSTEVLEAQASLADAQLAEVRAVADYEIAQVDLAVATGTLLGAAKVRWEPIAPPVK
jgi:outer membrane protein